MKKQLHIVFIGMGAVGKAVIEILNISSKEHIKQAKITIVEPLEIPKWISQMFTQIKHIKKSVTSDNVQKLLKPLFNKHTFVIDVSVEVDSIPIMVLAKQQNVIGYLNTSVEDWSNPNPEYFSMNRDKLIKRSLSYRSYLVEKALGKVHNSTIIQEFGMNPGFISISALLGLYNCAMKYGSNETKKAAENGQFNIVAKNLGLLTIQSSEHDTQITKLPRPKGTFWNTWSANGLQRGEGLDPVQIGWGSHEDQKQGISDPKILDKTHIFPMRGMDEIHETIGLDYNGDPISFNGFLIPHGESDSLSKFLATKDYNPTVYYVYNPSEAAKESLEEQRNNKHKPLSKSHVLTLPEIKMGYDSVGTLLIFSGKGETPSIMWWTGSCMSVEDAYKCGFVHSGPTVVQVAASIYSAFKYVLEHKHLGLVTPEELDYKYILKTARPYLGNLYSKEIKI